MAQSTCRAVLAAVGLKNCRRRSYSNGVQSLGSVRASPKRVVHLAQSPALLAALIGRRGVDAKVGQKAARSMQMVLPPRPSVTANRGLRAARIQWLGLAVVPMPAETATATGAEIPVMAAAAGNRARPKMVPAVALIRCEPPLGSAMRSPALAVVVQTLLASAVPANRRAFAEKAKILYNSKAKLGGHRFRPAR